MNFNYEIFMILEKIRVEKGISVVKIVEAIGVNKSTYYRWRVQNTKIDPKKLERMCEFLGIDKDRFKVTLSYIKEVDLNVL